jgi:hypothetical protein
MCVCVCVCVRVYVCVEEGKVERGLLFGGVLSSRGRTPLCQVCIRPHSLDAPPCDHALLLTLECNIWQRYRGLITAVAHLRNLSWSSSFKTWVQGDVSQMIGMRPLSEASRRAVFTWSVPTKTQPLSRSPPRHNPSAGPHQDTIP